MSSTEKDLGQTYKVIAQTRLEARSSNLFLLPSHYKPSKTSKILPWVTNWTIPIEVLLTEKNPVGLIIWNRRIYSLYFGDYFYWESPTGFIP